MGFRLLRRGESFNLPFWLDSFGTVLIAYLSGPVCGAIVGISLNIVYGILYSYTYIIYGIVSMAIGIIVGVCAKRRWFEHLFGTLSVGFLLTLVSVVVSVPCNYIFFDGQVQNVWGDGIIALFTSIGINSLVSHIAGQFYIDFLDKVLMCLCLYFLIKIFRNIKKKKNKKETERVAATLLAIVLTVQLLFTYGGTSYAADETGAIDFDRYVQTIYNNENGLPGGKANDIAQTTDGVLWIGTYGGLYRYNGAQFTLMDNFESVKNANCLYTDEAGRLWIGTNDSGLSICINDNIANVLDESDGLGADSVRCITQGADGRYYIGTTGSMSVVTLSGGLSVDTNIEEIVYAYSVSADTEGNVAVVTDEGVLYLVRGTEVVASYQNKENGYTCCQFTEDGSLYVGTEGNKIIRYAVAEDGLDNTKLLCLMECTDGSVLAGSDGAGIYRIQDGKVTGHYSKEDGLSSGVVLRLVKSMDDEGVFVVTSNSLSYMDADGNIRECTNFPYYNNFDVVERQDGTLFVLSSAGIYVVDKKELLEGGALEYKLLNAKMGLQKSLTPNSWNYMDADENLYLSTDTGVVKFNLNQYDVATRSYRMYVKTIKIDDTVVKVERGEPTILERGVNRIEIVPEVINYSVNDPYVSIWLEGFDKEPKVVRQSELTNVVYMNLATNTYIFHLAVLDSKGQSVVAESTYTIEKEKEIYDYWWFRLYAIFVFTLAMFYMAWLVIRTQIQRTIAMQKRELGLAKNQIEMGNETVLTIARTVDAKDENTSQHSVRVSEYSVLIAKQLGYNAEQCETLRKTALLHDIGKIGIPDRVLNKPSRLDDEEYEIMKSHVVKGAEILKKFTLIDNVQEGALYHHERYDGKGYVHGLKGEEIPLNARIIGIADAFDAMTANRVYRKKLDFDFVLGELKKGRGTQFDPKLVDIMLSLIEEGVIDVTSLY